MVNGTQHPPRVGGIKIHVENELQSVSVSEWCQEQIGQVGAQQALIAFSDGLSIHLQIREPEASNWAPERNTALLCQRLRLDTEHDEQDLELEILLAMLLSPIPFEFPSHHELTSAIRIRSSIVAAARRTVLEFGTTEADRPDDYWRYDEDRGFVMLPGKSLIAALEESIGAKASQKLYTFSCRRATEYLVLLGLAREAEISNQRLFEQLHHQAQTRALKGSEFERAFVRTIGSSDRPLPVRYFVPGDRTWFRNIDSVSSDITGYEGSWTIYLGAGLFADFWRPGRVFTLESKLACVYHWRNATYQDDRGELRIDEEKVDELTTLSCQSPEQLEQILRDTLRLQAPLGTDGGGCIESHREHPCRIRPETTDVILPDLPKGVSRQSGAV